MSDYQPGCNGELPVANTPVLTNLQLAEEFAKEFHASGTQYPLDRNEWRAISMFAEWLDKRPAPEPPVIRCPECGATPNTEVVVHWQHECTHDAETTTESTASVSLNRPEGTK